VVHVVTVLVLEGVVLPEAEDEEEASDEPEEQERVEVSEEGRIRHDEAMTAVEVADEDWVRAAGADVGLASTEELAQRSGGVSARHGAGDESVAVIVRVLLMVWPMSVFMGMRMNEESRFVMTVEFAVTERQ